MGVWHASTQVPGDQTAVCAGGIHTDRNVHLVRAREVVKVALQWHRAGPRELRHLQGSGDARAVLAVAWKLTADEANDARLAAA